ncbi:hypothetical protein UC8_42930 [Roseimaritima ulvae]|uniref:Uncharacterized protein n=2 Tax=Roseimaritima ulvae TaxID=980254 RepID=A0A5B9QWH4_9BACT|nr:hypothetical protein UC8_42930 [Roseimaritima ulvae]
MLAGDVTANFAAGVLTITGDGSGNGVEMIPGDNPGEYRVIGTDVNGAMTQVTGTGVFIEDPLTAVNVNLAGGSDTFTIRGLSVANQLAINGAVTITDPSGSNTFEVINARISGALTVNGGVDEDNVLIDGSRIIGATSLLLGVGDNSAMLVSGSILDGTLTYNGGAGEDSVFIVEAEIDGVVAIATDGGNDKVVFGMSTDPTVGGNININLGAGNDRAIIHDTDAKRRVNINGGAGNNIVDIEQSMIGVSVVGTVLQVTNALGHDTLSIRDTLISDDVVVNNGAAGQTFGSETDIVDSEIRGDFNLTGDGGVDMFNVTDTEIRNDVTLIFGNGESFVTFLRADLGDDLSITGGIHRDDVTLEATILEGDASISLLQGVDRLSLLAGTQLKGISTLSGGAGPDIDTFVRELAPDMVDIALLNLTQFETHLFVNN